MSHGLASSSYSLEFDLLIIGSGIAGLTAAIKAQEAGLQVAVVTRAQEMTTTNTALAQGGIIFPRTTDHLLLEDIDRAAAQTSDPAMAQILLQESGAILQEILIDKANTDFAKDQQNELEFTLEGAHSVSRIIYKGDYTGRAIQDALLTYALNAQRASRITFITQATLLDLITPAHHGTHFRQRYEPPQVVGAYLFDRLQKCVHKVMAKKVVLATGGAGEIYLHHTNNEGIRGDGVAAAYRTGAQLMNMEFIQFHPTTFFHAGSTRRFLVTEAVRGEGGVLLNSAGSRFMPKYHASAELAPRDVVARAILNEMIESGHDCVYLDISFKSANWIQDRFPTIYQHCLKHGLDITQHPIPVVPAAHYLCGGIRVDEWGQTNIRNLYAIGEASCTGIHGRNRLASTSLLEGLTWGYRAAQHAARTLLESADPIYCRDQIIDWKMGSVPCDMALVAQDWQTLRQTMWNYVGLKRSFKRLQRAQSMLYELSNDVSNFYWDAELSDELIGLRNGIEVAKAIVKSSMINRFM